jgi:hypothetical protein
MEFDYQSCGENRDDHCQNSSPEQQWKEIDLSAHVHPPPRPEEIKLK